MFDESRITRRRFVAGTLAGATLGTMPFLSRGSDKSRNLTVQEVIDLILAHVPGDRLARSVDRVKAGDPGTIVRGIATTMFPTVDVLRRAAGAGANFVIVHEPSFYNHHDDVDWLEGDDVYNMKRELIISNEMVIWRFHDYWHRVRPDGIRMGVLNQLAWVTYYDESHPELLTLPQTRLSGIIRHLKERLGIEQVRYIGDLNETCRRIALMPGAVGGRAHIELLKRDKPDVLICGEAPEWETVEYIRDARALGLRRSLVVLGHVQSEEPGMEWLVQWLQPKIPGVRITHISSHSPFEWF